MIKTGLMSGVVSGSTLLLGADTPPSGEQVWSGIAAVLLGAVLGGVASNLSQRSRLERLENKLSELDKNVAVLIDREGEKRHGDSISSGGE